MSPNENAAGDTGIQMCELPVPEAKYGHSQATSLSSMRTYNTSTIAFDDFEMRPNSEARFLPAMEGGFGYMHNSRSSLSLSAYGKHNSRRMSSWSQNATGNKNEKKTRTKSHLAFARHIDEKESVATKILLVPKNLNTFTSKTKFEEIELEASDSLNEPDALDDDIPNDKYTIQRLAKRDDEERLATWRKIAFQWTPWTAVISQGLFWTYLTFRTMYTLKAQRVAHRFFPLAWTFLVVECIIAFPNVFFNLWRLCAFRKRKRAQLRLLGDDVPSVDLFVTCCGEDISLVMDTARAACDMDYPMYSFRVIILDDGGDEELRKVVERESASRLPNLFYHARTKIPGVPHNFKAGNLNGGLEFVDKLPGGAGEFMAALDADMLPSPDLLRALIPHLLLDPKLGMSCPPQLFYNAPDDDILCQSLDFFVHVSEPLKDSLGVAWCTGSGYCVRRAALTDIGNFPYGSLAEDVCFSSMLLGKGWRCAYVHEPLQWGTVPDSFEGHIKQRTRWVIGTIQTALKLNFYLYGQDVRHMTFWQRACGLLYSFSACFSIFLTMALFIVPIVLLSGGTMIAYTTLFEARLLLRLYFADMFFTKTAEWLNYAPLGSYFAGQRGGPASTWMSPFYCYCIVRSFLLPKWIAGPAMGFKPSGSTKSDLNERDPLLRAPLITRMRVILWNNKVFFHLFQVMTCIAGVALSTTRCAQYGSSVKISGCMLQNAWWPPLAWLVSMSACIIPIYYMFCPPSTPDRETLLERDERGIAQPSERAKRNRSTSVSVAFEVVNLIVIAYTTTLFVLSFFLTDAHIHWR